MSRRTHRVHHFGTRETRSIDREETSSSSPVSVLARAVLERERTRTRAIGRAQPTDSLSNLAEHFRFGAMLLISWGECDPMTCMRMALSPVTD